MNNNFILKFSIVWVIVVLISLLTSIGFSQTFELDSNQARKSIQIKFERDSLRIVNNYLTVESTEQETVILAQAGKIKEKDAELKLVYDMNDLLKKRVSDLEKQPKEVIKVNSYTFFEIAGYTFLIVAISFVAGLLAM